MSLLMSYQFQIPYWLPVWWNMVSFTLLLPNLPFPWVIVRFSVVWCISTLIPYVVQKLAVHYIWTPDFVLLMMLPLLSAFLSTLPIYFIIISFIMLTWITCSVYKMNLKVEINKQHLHYCKYANISCIKYILSMIFFLYSFQFLFLMALYFLLLFAFIISLKKSLSIKYGLYFPEIFLSGTSIPLFFRTVDQPLSWDIFLLL